jgi:hypothetical protein
VALNRNSASRRSQATSEVVILEYGRDPVGKHFRITGREE